MFYFFEKEQQYIRCELLEEPGGWELMIAEPDRLERSEHFHSSRAAYARWEELQAGFKGDGWFGPYGRD
jgi:hypothetical protein